MVLGPRELESFERDGFVALRRAVPTQIAEACCDAVWVELSKLGVRREDPASWTRPVVRVNTPDGASFVEAGTSPTLWAAYDALIGPGRWRRRRGVGGTVPVRFPSSEDPGDAGWHIDGSYDVDGEWWVNVQSRGRGLLALFLFSDVTIDDAPTRVLVGSHLDVPSVLAPAGERGTTFRTDALPRRTFERDVAFATGEAGDVFLCHPFLVHAASWPHRGARPRLIAQPGVDVIEPFTLVSSESTCAVERAIIRGLSQGTRHPTKPTRK
jgi:Phytanoyl-CoA dioxygenase (PhyH)